MQADLMHESVHDKSSSGHISGILKQGNEHIEQENIRKEYENASHTSDHSVNHKVLYPAICHSRSHKCSQLADEPFNPAHRIITYRECSLEHHIQKQEEDREGHPTVGHDCVYLVCQGILPS